MSKAFHLRYRCEPGEWSTEEARKLAHQEGWGFTDELLLISVRRGPVRGEGDISMKVLGMSGYRNGPPGSTDLFKAMMCLARTITEDKASNPWHVGIAGAFMEAVRTALGYVRKDQP